MQSDIAKELENILSKFDQQISKLLKKNETDYLLIALRNICKYTSLLFGRLIANQNAPIEHVAISARNLFECYLLIAYILDDTSRAKEFVSQKPFEEIEINEGFLSLTTTNTPEASLKVIQAYKDYTKQLAREFGLTPSRHWTVSHLAIKTDNKVEYDAFFKLYSKYVHPSSWIINSHDFEYDNPVFRSIFFSQGHIFTRRVVKLISKYQEQ